MALSKLKRTKLKRKTLKKTPQPGRPRYQKKKALKHVPFPFMDLPAELRNNVYAEVAKDNIAVLEKGTLTDNSPLSQVSAQIHDEYMPILALNAEAIKTEVLDFDFRHIVTFINRLSATMFNALPKITNPDTRAIDIALRFSRADEVKSVDLLHRWLKRAGSTTKIGTTLRFRYSLVRLAGPTTTAVWEGRRGPQWLDPWWEQLVNASVEWFGDGRPREEAVKIQRRFLNAQQQELQQEMSLDWRTLSMIRVCNTVYA